MKILVLTGETLTADRLRGALPARDDPSNVEVLILAPALQDSGLKFWVSDADDAIAEADEVQRESVAELDAAGITASGDTGESDPMQAIEDALQTFAADHIVLVVSEASEHHRGALDADEVSRRFGVPASTA